VLCRCDASALCLSHDLRRDVRVHLVLGDEFTVTVDGSEVRNLRPDERSTAAGRCRSESRIGPDRHWIRLLRRDLDQVRIILLRRDFSAATRTSFDMVPDSKFPQETELLDDGPLNTVGGEPADPGFNQAALYTVVQDAVKEPLLDVIGTCCWSESPLYSVSLGYRSYFPPYRSV
jgi:hypothetical protein